MGQRKGKMRPLYECPGFPVPSVSLLLVHRVSQHEQLQYSGPINLFTLASKETMPLPVLLCASGLTTSLHRFPHVGQDQHTLAKLSGIAQSDTCHSEQCWEINAQSSKRLENGEQKESMVDKEKIMCWQSFSALNWCMLLQQMNDGVLLFHLDLGRQSVCLCLRFTVHAFYFRIESFQGHQDNL